MPDKFRLPGRPWENRGWVRYYRQRLNGRDPHPPRGRRAVSRNEESRERWEGLGGPAVFKHIDVVRDIKRFNTRARRREEERQTREEVDDWMQ